MRAVYFETENAILRVDYDDIVEKVPYYESVIGTAEATALRDLLASPDQSITVPREQYRFPYFTLDLIEKGKGAVYCKACKRYYEAKELEQVAVGHGESPFSVNVRGRGLWKRIVGKKERLPLFGGKGYQCRGGHELISVVTWRT